MTLDPARIRDALRSVRFPGYPRDIVSFGMVADVQVSEDDARVALRITTRDPAKKAQVLADAEAACRAAGAVNVRIVDSLCRALDLDAAPRTSSP